jgi:DNA-binding NarL/FixJ family response regulator
MTARYRIFVVDDHPLMIEALERRLGAESALEIVGVARSGDEAIARAGRCAAEVVLVHLGHHADVADVLGELRERCPSVRRLAMVDQHVSAPALEHLAALADGLVTTRATAEDVIDAIEVVLAGGTALAPELGARVLRGYASRRRRTIGPHEVREMRALELAVEGLTDAEIAAELGVSRRTVQRLLARVREREGLRRRADLVRWGAGRGESADGIDAA